MTDSALVTVESLCHAISNINTFMDQEIDRHRCEIDDLKRELECERRYQKILSEKNAELERKIKEYESEQKEQNNA